MSSCARAPSRRLGLAALILGPARRIAGAGGRARPPGGRLLLPRRPAGDRRPRDRRRHRLGEVRGVPRPRDSGFRIPRLRLFGESADGDRTLSTARRERGPRRWPLHARLRSCRAVRAVPRLQQDPAPLRQRRPAALEPHRPRPLEIPDPVQGAHQTALQQQFHDQPGRHQLRVPRTVCCAGYPGRRPSSTSACSATARLARFDLGRLGPLAWNLEYSHENRAGTRPFGAQLRLQQRHRAARADRLRHHRTPSSAGEWNTQRGGLRFGYRYSTFENNVSTLIWDNPFRIDRLRRMPNAYQSPSPVDQRLAPRASPTWRRTTRRASLFVGGPARSAALVSQRQRSLTSPWSRTTRSCPTR